MSVAVICLDALGYVRDGHFVEWRGRERMLFSVQHLEEAR